MMLRTKLFLITGQLACALMFPSVANAEVVEGGPAIINPGTFVEDNGMFTTRYPTIEAAKLAALGNVTNQGLRKTSEFLFLNNPCEDKFNYSFYFTDRRFRYVPNVDNSGDLSAQILAQVTALDQPYIAKLYDIDAVYDAQNPSPETIDDQLMAKLYADLLTFSYKRTADCEPIPLGIIFRDGRYKMFERNDAGTSLVGKRFHDATVIEATRITVEQAKTLGDEKLAAKGVPNEFYSLNGAVEAAKRIAGDKIVMFDGQVMRIYRAHENMDIPGIGRMYKNLGEYMDALKEAKPENGMTILALVIGDKGAAAISTPAT